MSETATHEDLRVLLEQTGWVRQLAGRLASGADADEIEQATWLAALRFRAQRRAPVREWLAAIARNLARQQRRSRARRAEHEERAAVGEELAATVDLVARAELQRTLAAAVMELDEPYRSVVLLRYFESLPPRAVAERLGLPVATVRTRLSRALARLRARLDAEHGGERGPWVAALAPLCTKLNAPTFGWGALIAMNAKIVIACVALSALGAAAWWISGSAGVATGPEDPRAASAARTSAPMELPPVESVPGALAARESMARAEAVQSDASTRLAPTAASAPAAPPASLRGRVLDADGRGLPGAVVLARARPGADGPGDARATAGADGAFVLESAPSSGVLESGSRELATVLGASFGPSTREGVTTVLAPRLDFAGRVVDESGASLVGARLAVAMPEDLRSRFGVVLDHAQGRTWQVVSAQDGAFALEDVPLVEGASLLVEAPGFEPLRMPEPGLSDLSLRVVLRRPRSEDGFVRGLVVDPAGRAVPGAWVAFGIDTQRSAADGSFAFRIDDPDSFGRRVGLRAERITALAPGWLPASYEPPRVEGAPAWPERITLRLAGETLSLAGRVVDAEGEPLAGIRVYVADATLFGAVEGRPAVVETLFAPGDATWKFVESDAEGRFVLDGLLERDYVVRAHDPRTLLRVDSEPTPAGRSDLELRLPTEQLYPLVAGRVLSLGGEPIAGAEVHPMCDAFQIAHDGHPLSTSHGGVEGTTTDAQGRFALHDVPMSLVYLRVDGESILPVEYGRFVEGDPRFARAEVRELPRERITELEIHVEARCHMQVELARADAADELCVLDAQGRELELSLYEAGARRDGERHPIHDGRSAMLSVPESGRTLVLFRAGAEVARVPIRLVPGEPRTVRL